MLTYNFIKCTIISILEELKNEHNMFNFISEFMFLIIFSLAIPFTIIFDILIIPIELIGILIYIIKNKDRK